MNRSTFLKTTTFLFIPSMIFLLYTLSWGQEKTPIATNESHGSNYQTVCPAGSETTEIVKDAFLDYQGNRIYTCCAGCFPRIKQDPEKYLKIMGERGEQPYLTAQVTMQKECPVDNKVIDTTYFLDHEWERFYLCSNKCQKKITKKPGKYLDD